MYVCVWVLVTSKDTNGVKNVLKSDFEPLFIWTLILKTTYFPIFQPSKSTMKIMDNVSSPKMIMRLPKGLKPIVVLQLGSSSMNALCTNCMMAIVKILIWREFKFFRHKVHIFWEGHKILRSLHLTFDCMYCSQKLGEDFSKFCGLLRIYELQ